MLGHKSRSTTMLIVCQKLTQGIMSIVSLSINGRKLACSIMHNFDVCITLEIQNYLMGVRIVMQNLNVRVI